MAVSVSILFKEIKGRIVIYLQDDGKGINPEQIKAKIIEKPVVFTDFYGLERSKIDPKSMPKRIQKKHRRKTSKKSILASI